jgi:glycosyltransferase involved in cell wall biosynthesis
MKVLWVHNFDPKSLGSGSFMYTFSQALSDAGVKVELMYLGDLRSPGAIFRARDSVSRVSRRYDIVHSQFGSACGVVGSAALCRRVLTLRGSDWHRYAGPNLREAAHASIAVAFTRYSVVRHEAVIAVSNRMAAEIQQSFPQKRVSVIPDPIDLSLFSLQCSDMVRRRVLESCDTSPWVLFTSLNANNPVKRVALAREAVDLARRRIPNLELRVASGLSHRDVPDFVAACDVQLCTSTHEGWPNSVKEAMACGLPFVSTDVSDLREICKQYPECHVVDAVPEKIADALECAIKFGRSPRLREAVVDMGLEVSAARLLSVYTEVLNL